MRNLGKLKFLPGQSVATSSLGKKINKKLMEEVMHEKDI